MIDKSFNVATKPPGFFAFFILGLPGERCPVSTLADASNEWHRIITSCYWDFVYMLYASFRLHQALLKTSILYLQEKHVSKTVSIYSLCPNMGTDSHINSRRGLQRGKRERPRFVFGKPWGLLSILIKRKLNHTQYHTQYHTSQLVFVALGICYFIPRVNIGKPNW